MIVLSKRQVILLHKDLIDQTGGIEGLRDEGCWIQHCQRLFKVLKIRSCIHLFIKRQQD